jgi:DNA-directed RNA polymerase specialized sigma24 family protein
VLHFNSIATLRKWRHDRRMASGRTGPIAPDLFSTASPQETISRPPKSTTSSRHILPSDLPAAIKHLNDNELEQLLAAVIAERLQRGMKSPVPARTTSKRPVEAATVSLTPGKLNAVRAAFKAGVTPSRIAKEFGIPQSEVRKALASDRPKP